MPRDGFSFTVFIGCQPYLFSFLGILFQFAYKFFLVIGNFIFWHESIVIDAQLSFLQIPDMTVTRHNLEVATQEFFNRLRLCGRLYYYEIFLHFLSQLIHFGLQKYAKNSLTPYLYREIFVLLTILLQESVHRLANRAQSEAFYIYFPKWYPEAFCGIVSSLWKGIIFYMT